MVSQDGDLSYDATMTNALEKALATIRTMPEDVQNVAAMTLESIAENHAVDANALMSDAQRAELKRRFEEPFEAARQEEVKAFFARHDA